jgi:hypothetical protein
MLCGTAGRLPGRDCNPGGLAAKRHGEVAKVVKSRLQADAGFRPLASDQLLKLAEFARDAGDRALARSAAPLGCGFIADASVLEDSRA